MFHKTLPIWSRRFPILVLFIRCGWRSSLPFCCVAFGWLSQIALCSSSSSAFPGYQLGFQGAGRLKGGAMVGGDNISCQSFTFSPAQPTDPGARAWLQLVFVADLCEDVLDAVWIPSRSFQTLQTEISCLPRPSPAGHNKRLCGRLSPQERPLQSWDGLSCPLV